MSQHFTTRNTPVARTLNKAADLIEEHGWTQGAGGWGDGSNLCLEGAIYAAMGGSIWTEEYVDGERQLPKCRAYKAVVEFLEWTQGPLYRWNDETGRTKEEVVAVLRATAFVTAAREEAEARGRAHYAA